MDWVVSHSKSTVDPLFESLYTVLTFDDFFEVFSESLYVEILEGLFYFDPLEAFCLYI